MYDLGERRCHFNFYLKRKFMLQCTYINFINNHISSFGDIMVTLSRMDISMLIQHTIRPGRQDYYNQIVIALGPCQ